MDSTAAHQTAPQTGDFDVLSDDELADVVGGNVYETVNGASSTAMRKLGGCGCAAGH